MVRSSRCSMNVFRVDQLDDFSFTKLSVIANDENNNQSEAEDVSLKFSLLHMVQYSKSLD